MATESTVIENTTAIKTGRLSRAFGDHLAVSNIDLSVPTGRTLTVFGPNGSGKSTLLRMFATLLTPSSGALNVLGCDLPRDAHSLRAKIGYLGHDPLLYRELTPTENLSFFARLYGLVNVEQRSKELLDAVGVSRYVDEPVRTLSRGTLQRIAACRSVLHEPELLLLDEPYSHLDPSGWTRVEPLIGSSTPATRVIVTHDIDAGLTEADSVLCLFDSRAVLSQDADGVGEAKIRELCGGSIQ